MAPIAQQSVAKNGYDGSRPRYESLQAWLRTYGHAEYAIFKRDNPPAGLSYEEWSASEHVLGPYLWHATLDVWEEDDTSSVGPYYQILSPKINVTRLG